MLWRKNCEAERLDLCATFRRRYDDGIFSGEVVVENYFHLLGPSMIAIGNETVKNCESEDDVLANYDANASSWGRSYV